ncbi:MAG TPA: RNA polymerase subunit sigma-24 [Chloroflexi bacterium]|nr:RNA polymerase subunit sigma-24 [Chloroflexota bacterium]
MRDDPDFELVQSMVAGDSQALETLYARHGSSLLVYLVGQLGQRSLAEEVLQDVMLAAWQAAPRFRGESQVRVWLFSIARYRAINARRRRMVPPVPLEPNLLARDPCPADLVERQDRLDAIVQAMSELPDELRETLELVFFHELSGPEAAEVMGVAPGTVKSRLHRAKAALKQWLSGEETNHHEE